MKRWKRFGNGNAQIASVLLTDFARYTDALISFLGEEDIPYSGVILSHDDAQVDGETIEGACYAKGGYRMLYRHEGGNAAGTDDFPVDSFRGLLEHLATIYLTDVVQIRVRKLYVDLCWAVCQREGDYGTLHNHIPRYDEPSDRYSGMLYLAVPPSIAPENFPNGCLHFVTREEVLYVPPIAGGLVFWPSALLHGIHPFRGPGDRLGISFDIEVEPVPLAA